MQEYQTQLRKMIDNSKKVQLLNKQQQQEVSDLRVLNQNLQDQLNLEKETARAYQEIQVDNDARDKKYETELSSLRAKNERLHNTVDIHLQTVNNQQQQLAAIQKQFAEQAQQFSQV